MTPGGGLPDWLKPVADAALGVRPEQLSRFRPPATGGRAGAVLILFGMGETGPDVLLIERAHDMRSHAGQMAFPGGAVTTASCAALTPPSSVASARRTVSSGARSRVTGKARFR